MIAIYLLFGCSMFWESHLPLLSNSTNKCLGIFPFLSSLSYSIIYIKNYPLGIIYGFFFSFLLFLNLSFFCSINFYGLFVSAENWLKCSLVKLDACVNVTITSILTAYICLNIYKLYYLFLYFYLILISSCIMNLAPMDPTYRLTWFMLTVWSHQWNRSFFQISEFLTLLFPFWLQDF